jgi:uncharacterized protein YggU (UPF0235/DUF167 family)
MKDLSKNFNVRVTTHARQNKVVEMDGVFRVYTTAVPENGRANDAVIDLLSEYLNVPKTRIKIVKGHSSRDKIFTID